MYAQVIVDIAHSQTDKIFEYSCPDDVVRGCRVKVPFGGRIVDGFVVGVSETSQYPENRIKPVHSTYDEEPAIIDECFSLMEYISNRYRVPKALSLRLFMPSEMRKGKVKEAYKSYAVYAADVDLRSGADKQKAALEYVKERGEVEYSALCSDFGTSAVLSLVKKGAIKKTQKKQQRTPVEYTLGDYAPKELTPKQKECIESIERTDKTVTLIHGVTGSGKTEVYLNIIAKVLSEGKSAIFLVPEISLTPQMLSQFRQRFGDEAAILHSGLTPGERFDEWWRIRRGMAKIVIGARSAIFAPLKNIGVIIIDEEHDSSYRSETNPRYSTLEIAKRRAKYNGCKIILGSATPSLESFLATREGRYNLFNMPKRINGMGMPEIEVVDMRREVKAGNLSVISSSLREELNRTLDRGNQAILFLNRRGHSSSVVCRECGYVARCARCDVALTYHSEENCLKCHYCGSRYKKFSVCPQCGGTHIKYGGVGTQKVVEELKKVFPEARIVRMDNDTVSGKDGHYKILKEFAQKKADFLVGTQMIAKGHDFPSVTLVGIIDADMSLHFADYRAQERTFQLITQVAGRCGRAKDAGKVIVQTSAPENYTLRFAAGYDYLGYFDYENSLRQLSMYPPYSIIIRIMVTGEDEDASIETLKGVYSDACAVRDTCPKDFLFFNKMHSPVKRIENKYRYQVLMRIINRDLVSAFYDIASRYTSAKVLVYVEENPVNLS